MYNIQPCIFRWNRFQMRSFSHWILAHPHALWICSACWGGVLQWVLQESHLQPFAWSDESTLPRVACQPFSVPFRLPCRWSTGHWSSNGKRWKIHVDRFASMAVRYFDVWSFTEQAVGCHPDVFEHDPQLIHQGSHVMKKKHRLAVEVPEDCLYGHMTPASAAFMIQVLLSSRSPSESCCHDS